MILKTQRKNKMKKLHLIFNHNIFDSPYKQSSVNKMDKEILSLFKEDDVDLFLSLTSTQSPNQFTYDADLIIVEHSFNLSAEQKHDIAAIINKSLAKLKSADPIDVLVSFRKTDENDLFFFKDGKDDNI